MYKTMLAIGVYAGQSGLVAHEVNLGTADVAVHRFFCEPFLHFFKKLKITNNVSGSSLTAVG